MASSTFAQVRGRMVRQLREAAGLTQEQLATAAGYRGGGRVAVAKVEQGRAEPTADRLAGICEALHISLADLDQRVAAELVEEPRLRGGGRVQEAVLRGVAGAEAAENVRRQRVLAEETEYLQRETQARFEVAMVASDDARDRLVVPFLELASRVHGIPTPVEESRPGGLDLDLAAQVRVSVQDIGEITVGTLGGFKVMPTVHRVGVAGAEAVYAAVGAYATASTGAAIAGLSGAAKQNATLAWLGGGALASGGRGVAGGKSMLTGIVAVPLLLATGGVLVYKTMQFRSRAKDDAVRLTQAERALEARRIELARAWKWADEQADVLTALATDGAELMPEIRRRIESDVNVEWASLDQPAQRSLERALELVSAVLAINALSIWSMVSTIAAEPAPGVEDTNAAWIAAVLQHGRDLTRRSPGSAAQTGDT